MSNAPDDKKISASEKHAADAIGLRIWGMVAATIGIFATETAVTHMGENDSVGLVLLGAVGAAALSGAAMFFGNAHAEDATAAVHLAHELAQPAVPPVPEA